MPENANRCGLQAGAHPNGRSGTAGFLIRLLALFLSLGLCGAAYAESSLDVIRLRHRTAQQLMPAVEPLLEKGGVLSGELNTLFVRASAANREEIRRAIAALDVPLRRLMLSVRIDNAAAGKGTWGTRSEAAERSDQQVQTVDGGQAFIRIGQKLPVTLHHLAYGTGGVVVEQTVVERDIGSGFYAIPVLQGDRVTVEISPEQQSLSSTGDGAIRTSRIVTTVSGGLGEWIELGGSAGIDQSGRGGAVSRSTRPAQSQQRVLLRVEALD